MVSGCLDVRAKLRPLAVATNVNVFVVPVEEIRFDQNSTYVPRTILGFLAGFYSLVYRAWYRACTCREGTHSVCVA